ncbi:hypothetical protein [Brasilonema bromeliae]
MQAHFVLAQRAAVSEAVCVRKALFEPANKRMCKQRGLLNHELGML